MDREGNKGGSALSPRHAIFEAVLRDDAQAIASLLAGDPSLAREKWQGSLRECGADNESAFDDANLLLATHTPLLTAAYRGRALCVEALLPFSDIGERDESGDTALINAAIEGDEECVRLLLPLSDPNARNAAGKTALAVAAVTEATKALRMMLADDRVGRTTIEDALSNALLMSEREAALLLAQRVSPKRARTLLEICLANSRVLALEAVAEIVPLDLARQAVEQTPQSQGLPNLPRLRARVEAEDIRATMAKTAGETAGQGVFGAEKPHKKTSRL